MTATKTNSPKTLVVGMFYVVNAGTSDQKAVQAFSAKQASVCLCKGGQPRGNQIIDINGKSHCYSEELAVSWDRYNDLLRAFANAPVVSEDDFDMATLGRKSY